MIEAARVLQQLRTCIPSHYLPDVNLVATGDTERHVRSWQNGRTILCVEAVDHTQVRWEIKTPFDLLLSR